MILHFRFLIIGGAAGLGWFGLGQGKAEAAELGDELQAGGDPFGRDINFHPDPPLAFEYLLDPAHYLSKTSSKLTSLGKQPKAFLLPLASLDGFPKLF